jgi:spore maturation protein CgeB
MKKALKILALKVYSGIPEGFMALGHEVKVIPPDIGSKGLEEEIIARRPDLAFSLDQAGFDTEVFTRHKIPHVAWFLDNPLYWLGKVSISPYYLAFVHDKLYIERMKMVGFKKIFYLPFGTNPEIFNGVSLTEEDMERYGCNLSFVGNSIHTYYPKYLQWIRDPEDRRIADEVVRIQVKNPLLDIQDVIEVAGSSFGHPLRFKDTLSEEILMMCMEGVASSIIRKETLEEVADLGLSVYGDGGWRGMLGSTKAKVFGPIPYSRDGIAKLFIASKINLNISRVQFKTAINQRPFDVACAGGFILTDYRRDIGELFELGKEMVCYRDKEELRELSIYFLKHPEERREIAMKAKKRVLEEHTFERRIKEMVNLIREFFGI